MWVHQALKSPNVTVSSPGTEVSKCYCEFTGTEVSKCYCEFTRHWSLQMLLWVHQALRSPNVTVSSPGTEVSKCSLHFFLLLLCLCWFIRFVRQSSLPAGNHNMRHSHLQKHGILFVKINLMYGILLNTLEWLGRNTNCCARHSKTWEDAQIRISSNFC